MFLYLVQHAEAFSQEQYPDRPLTEEGYFQAQKTADMIRPLHLCVNGIWHSGKTRSLETAKIFQAAVTCSNELFHHTGISPKDPVEPVAKEILDRNHDLMIVGHLPFLSHLACLLLTGNSKIEILSFRNAGIICLQCTEDRHWRIQWMVVPMILSGTKVAT